MRGIDGTDSPMFCGPLSEWENNMSMDFQKRQASIAFRIIGKINLLLGTLLCSFAAPLYADETGQSQKESDLKVSVRSVDPPSGSVPNRTAEKITEGIDLSQIDTPVWRHALEQLAKRPGVKAGTVQLSVLRVILKGDQTPEVQTAPRGGSQRTVNGVRLFVLGGASVPISPSTSAPRPNDRPIHAMSTKLVSLDPQDAGGKYKELKSGDFVVVEHINSSQRNEGRDPLQVGSWTHRHADLWIPVPPRGELGVLGDLVLERVKPEEMGGVIVELDTAAVPEGSFKSMHFGPLFTGGMYGRTYQATDGGIAGTNRIAPGNYFLVLPGVPEEPGHWPVTVKPGETAYLRFRWNTERVLELIEQHSLSPRARSDQPPSGRS